MARRHLPVLFFLLQHFERDDLHPEIGAADVLDGFHLGYAKFRRLFSDVVDADDEHRSSVHLQLARGRADQHERILLTRDERRLPVAHHGLLLWIGSSKGDGFVR